MKRIFSFLLALSIAISLIGCDAVQRKFTRKKTVVKQPHFYQLKKYTKKPSPELYKQHFAYWASWQETLIQFIGENHKKDKQCIEEALGNLTCCVRNGNVSDGGIGRNALDLGRRLNDLG